jgi:hypothetical protein
MNTIKTIIKHNRILKKNPFNTSNFTELTKNINNIPDNYTQSDKKIIENIILNILNKKDIYNDEVDILINIIDKLSNKDGDINILKLSTLLLMMDRIYFIKREGIDIIVDKLMSIENKDIQNYLKIVQGKIPTSLNLKELEFKKGDLFKAPDGIIIELFGFIQVNGKIISLLYGQEGEKTIIDRRPLDVLINYPKIEKNIPNREKFSLSKAISGEIPKIERDGDRYLIILPPQFNVPKASRVIFEDINLETPLIFNKKT